MNRRRCQVHGALKDLEINLKSLDTLNQEEEERMKELFHKKQTDQKQDAKLAFSEMQVK